MEHLDFTQQDALLDFTAAYLDPNADPRQQSYPTFHYPNQPHAAWQQQLSLEAAMDNEGMSHPQHHHSHSHSHSMSSQQQQQGQEQGQGQLQQPHQQQQQQQAPRKVAARIEPPATVTQQQQQQQQHAGMASLNAFAAPEVPTFQSRGAPLPDDDHDDGLFALPISPRSPEMGKSPFSFAGNETAKYLSEEGAT